MIDTVTLSWKRPNECLRCIKSIMDNSGDNVRDIYVVINECNPTYQPVLDIRDPRVHVIPLKNNEGVVARNHALRRLSPSSCLHPPEYIAQIDDDVVVHPAWDEKALSELVSDVQAVGDFGCYVKDLSSFKEDNVIADVGEYVDIIPGYCWVFKNGGFLYDETFGMHWHEESDLQFQMREAGWRFKRIPSFCTHMHAGKFNHWEEYLAVNTRKLVDKWYPKQDKLHLEKH